MSNSVISVAVKVTKIGEVRILFSRPSCSTICSRFSSTILVGQFNYNTEDQQFLETDSKPLFKPLPKLSP